MRIWIDTEFNEYHGALISMALVAEDGREWYGVRFCDDPGWWVREHVMPQLLQQPERDADLRTGLAEFLGQFDAVHIVSDWPGDIAHFCNFLEYAPGDRIGPDTMTFEVRRDLPDTATTSAIPHNALEDARALAKVGYKKTINGMVRFAQTVLKERDEERDSLIHMQDIAIEQKDAEIAQLREQLAAYEAQPVVQICQLTPGKWTHLIERPHSTANLDAIKQEVRQDTRNEALDQAAAIVERQDVDPAFKLRMASAIRSLKEELPNPQKL